MQVFASLILVVVVSGVVLSIIPIINVVVEITQRRKLYALGRCPA